VDSENFSLDVLIRQMKDLQGSQLGDQVRAALEHARLGMDESSLAELVNEFQSDLQEHIGRLERINRELTMEERSSPENMSAERRREVAFKSGCDFEEIDSLCEAFAQVRSVLEELRQKGGSFDVSLLLGNLPGMAGIESDEVQHGLLKGILDGTIQPGATEGNRKSHLNFMQAGGKRRAEKRSGDLEDQIDTSRTHEPVNRLPKDWNPPEDDASGK
jgi:hypothetical protein